jgi:hypothetical protein
MRCVDDYYKALDQTGGDFSRETMALGAVLERVKKTTKKPAIVN